MYMAEKFRPRPTLKSTYIYISQFTHAYTPPSHTFMTPFESLLWTVWLPKVRTAINNEWSADQPQPAVKLYEVWSTFLPAFIRDNILDQLILPKVQQAIADWSPRKSTVPLQNLLFPWLPHLGLRLEAVIGDAKRKVKSLLRAWSPGQDLPIPLKAWKEVSNAESILVQMIIALSRCLKQTTGMPCYSNTSFPS